MDAQNFETIHDILRCFSLVQSLLKGRNTPIRRNGNQGVKWLYLSSVKFAVSGGQGLNGGDVSGAEQDRGDHDEMDDEQLFWN